MFRSVIIPVMRKAGTTSNAGVHPLAWVPGRRLVTATGSPSPWPKAEPSAASKSKPNAGSAASGNGLSISDFQIGDRITHDKFGLGTVVDLQDKGPKSVITVDFGSDGVKRLMLAVAPIEKL